MRLPVGLLIHGLWVLLEEKNSELFDEVQKQDFSPLILLRDFTGFLVEMTKILRTFPLDNKQHYKGTALFTPNLMKKNFQN